MLNIHTAKGSCFLIRHLFDNTSLEQRLVECLGTALTDALYEKGVKNMNCGPVRVGLKYCGGCIVRYDRIAALQTIREQCSPKTVFEPIKEGEMYDYILIINGCQAQCADRKKLHSKNGIFSVFQLSDPMVAVEEIRRIEAECMWHNHT